MRQTGWYRVKFKTFWEFAYFCDSLWYVYGTNDTYQDGQILEINEELQNPEPPKKTGLDGDGNTWSKKCECGNDMQVVRPGSAICVKCNDEILANDGMKDGFPKIRPTGLMTTTEVVDMSKFETGEIVGHPFGEKRNPVDRERDK